MAGRLNLPPLRALQAFTSAAAHLNFSQAARDLKVTASAISHQIRLLESVLGTKLFDRLPRGLEMTREGKALQVACEKAFSDISEVVEAIRLGSGDRVLRIASVPHFSAQRLFPARQLFAQRYPHLDISVGHTLDVPDFSDERFDFAVLFGTGDWHGLKSDLLFISPTAPVCAPALIERYGISEISDLPKAPVLLEHTCFHRIWVDWYAAAGREGWEKINYIPCEDIHALLTAATQGFGIIMEPDFIVAEQLAAGTLVRPFASKLRTHGYHLVYPAETLRRQACRTFRDWFVGHIRSLEPGSMAAEER